MPTTSKRGLESRNNRALRKSPKTQRNEKQKPIPPHQRLLQFISGFLNDAECAQDMFVTVIPALREQDKKTIENIRKTTALLRKDAKAEGPCRTRAVRHVRTLIKHVTKLSRAEMMFRGNALVGLVSRYDEFLSSILKSAYRNNPGRATAPDRSMTYDDLLTLDSLDNIVELFIAKEIDNLLHESHKKQLETIDREFKIGIIEHFSEFPQFIEIMERRNLLVHAGGIASKYYVKQCREVGYKKDNLPKEGTPLYIAEDYFQASVLCLSELAVRLGYALACRVYPDKLDDIHERFLSEVGFPLLMSEEWDLARRVFSFALSWPDKYVPGDLWIRFYAVNTAIALNQLKRHDEAVALLDRYDWSAQGSRFLLAVAVLRHKWTQAERLMSDMNGEKPFAEDNFRNWPIFKEFRETKEFRRAYKAVYGKRFVVRLSKEESDSLKKAAKAEESEQVSAPDAKSRSV